MDVQSKDALIDVSIIAGTYGAGAGTGSAVTLAIGGIGLAAMGGAMAVPLVVVGAGPNRVRTLFTSVRNEADRVGPT